MWLRGGYVCCWAAEGFVVGIEAVVGLLVDLAVGKMLVRGAVRQDVGLVKFRS